MSGDSGPAAAVLASVKRNGAVQVSKNAEVKLFLFSLLRLSVSAICLFVFNLHQCFFHLSTDGCLQPFFLQGAALIVRCG